MNRARNTRTRTPFSDISVASSDSSLNEDLGKASSKETMSTRNTRKSSKAEESAPSRRVSGRQKSVAKTDNDLIEENTRITAQAKKTANKQKSTKKRRKNDDENGNVTANASDSESESADESDSDDSDAGPKKRNKAKQKKNNATPSKNGRAKNNVRASARATPSKNGRTSARATPAKNGRSSARATPAKNGKRASQFSPPKSTQKRRKQNSSDSEGGSDDDEEDDENIRPKPKAQSSAARGGSGRGRGRRRGGAASQGRLTVQKKVVEPVEEISDSSDSSSEEEVDEDEDLSCEKLFDAIKDGKSGLNDFIDQWFAVHQEDSGKAILLLINVILQACGCDTMVGGEDFDDREAQEIINELEQTFQDQEDFGNLYPIKSKKPAFKKFPSRIIQFFDLLFKKHYFLNEEVINTIVEWLAVMSSSPVRPFRHTATFLGVKILTTLLKIFKTENEKLENKETLLEKQSTQKKRRSGISNQLVEEIDSLQKKLESLEETFMDIFKKIFVNRSRDSNTDIRVLCVVELGIWMETSKSKFLSDEFLKYLGWKLHDKESSVRLKTVHILGDFYKDYECKSAMENFTMRWKDRMLQMINDTNEHVCVAAINLFSPLIGDNLLDEEDFEKIHKLFFSSEKTNKALGTFVAAQFSAKDFGLEIDEDDEEEEIPSLSDDEDDDDDANSKDNDDDNGSDSEAGSLKKEKQERLIKRVIKFYIKIMKHHTHNNNEDDDDGEGHDPKQSHLDESRKAHLFVRNLWDFIPVLQNRNRMREMLLSDPSPLSDEEQHVLVQLWTHTFKAQDEIIDQITSKKTKDKMVTEKVYVDPSKLSKLMVTFQGTDEFAHIASMIDYIDFESDLSESILQNLIEKLKSGIIRIKKASDIHLCVSTLTFLGGKISGVHQIEDAFREITDNIYKDLNDIVNKDDAATEMETILKKIQELIVKHDITTHHDDLIKLLDDVYEQTIVFDSDDNISSELSEKTICSLLIIQFAVIGYGLRLNKDGLSSKIDGLLRDLTKLMADDNTMVKLQAFLTWSDLVALSPELDRELLQEAQSQCQKIVLLFIAEPNVDVTPAMLELCSSSNKHKVNAMTSQQIQTAISINCIIAFCRLIIHGILEFSGLLPFVDLLTNDLYSKILANTINNALSKSATDISDKVYVLYAHLQQSYLDYHFKEKEEMDKDKKLLLKLARAYPKLIPVSVKDKKKTLLLQQQMLCQIHELAIKYALQDADEDVDDDEDRLGFLEIIQQMTPSLVSGPAVKMLAFLNERLENDEELAESPEIVKFKSVLEKRIVKSTTSATATATTAAAKTKTPRKRTSVSTETTVPAPASPGTTSSSSPTPSP